MPDQPEDDNAGPSDEAHTTTASDDSVTVTSVDLDVDDLDADGNHTQALRGGRA